jgi:hypothetical protein
MSFQAVVTKGAPLRVRKETCNRRVQVVNLDHQMESLRVFLDEPSITNGEEWESLPMTEDNINDLINRIKTELHAQEPRGGKRSKRKRPKRKSKKLKYFFLKRK